LRKGEKLLKWIIIVKVEIDLFGKYINAFTSSQGYGIFLGEILVSLELDYDTNIDHSISKGKQFLRGNNEKYFC